jgi:hypothetical protein
MIELIHPARHHLSQRAKAQRAILGLGVILLVALGLPSRYFWIYELKSCPSQ